MQRKWTFLCALLLSLSSCGIEGLHNANPATRIDATATGLHFYNNKDVSLELEEGTYNPETKQLNIKDLKVEDNASSVRKANELQMEGMARQAEANWNGAMQFIERLPDLVTKFTPWVRPDYSPPLSLPGWLGGLFLLLIGVPLALLLVLAVLLVAYKAARAAWAWATRSSARSTSNGGAA